MKPTEIIELIVEVLNVSEEQARECYQYGDFDMISHLQPKDVVSRAIDFFA